MTPPNILTFLTNFQERVWLLLRCILHPGKVIDPGKTWSGGTFTVSFAVSNVLRANWFNSYSAQCERVPQQTQQTQGQLSPLALHIVPASTSLHSHGSHQVSRTTQSSPVQNRSANDASQCKQARIVGLSHGGSVADRKIKKH